MTVVPCEPDCRESSPHHHTLESDGSFWTHPGPVEQSILKEKVQLLRETAYETTELARDLGIKGPLEITGFKGSGDQETPADWKLILDLDPE